MLIRCRPSYISWSYRRNKWRNCKRYNQHIYIYIYIYIYLDNSIIVIKKLRVTSIWVEQMIDDEETRLLRKEMVPKAQLMPFFDRPFLPQRYTSLNYLVMNYVSLLLLKAELVLNCRSNRPLTIPREPGFRTVNSKCWSCISENELYYFQHAHTWSPIKWIYLNLIDNKLQYDWWRAWMMMYNISSYRTFHCHFYIISGVVLSLSF